MSRDIPLDSHDADLAVDDELNTEADDMARGVGHGALGREGMAHEMEEKNAAGERGGRRRRRQQGEHSGEKGGAKADDDGISDELLARRMFLGGCCALPW
jgi:hypothetical protein